MNIIFSRTVQIKVSWFLHQPAELKAAAQITLSRHRLPAEAAEAEPKMLPSVEVCTFVEAG